MTKDTFKQMLVFLQFEQHGNIFTKHFAESEADLSVDFGKELLIYPLDKGFKVSGEFTSNFKFAENFVVFECVHRLLEKGYKPEHLELEIEEPWQLIESVDGFHINQYGHGVTADTLWSWLQTNKPDWLPPLNPHNADIERVFKDQGGY